MFSTEVEDKVVVVGTAERGPAHRADLQAGDVVLAVADSEVSDLAGFYRMMWSLGKAGVEVPLTISATATPSMSRSIRPTAPSCSRRQECIKRVH